MTTSLITLLEDFRTNQSETSLQQFMEACYEQCYSHVKMAAYGALKEDIITDVFIKFQKEIKKGKIFESDHHLLNYLRKIANNLSANSVKREARSTSFPEDYDIPSIEGEDELNLTNLLEKMAHNLPPKQQHVFRLRMAGKSNQEIAQLLNLKTNSVNQYLSRSYEILRKNFRDPRIET